MKYPILTVQSITPVEPYLSRRRAAPRSYQAQYEFALILLSRERDYLALRGTRWLGGERAAPEPGGPWEPWDLTPAAPRHLAASDAWARGETPRPDETPFDLFGLKEEAAAGLGGVVAARPSQAPGYLVLAVLLEDMVRQEAALAAAREAARLRPREVTGWAYVYSMALPGAAKRRKHASQALREARARATTLLGAATVRGRPLGWSSDALGDHRWGLQRAAWRIRARVEGERFTRFIRSEDEVYRAEQAAHAAALDAGAVPAEFRDLVPLARAYGMGDDACRYYFVRRTPRPERRAIVATLLSRAAAVGDWLDSFAPGPMPPHAAAFLYLLEAMEEMG